MDAQLLQLPIITSTTNIKAGKLTMNETKSELTKTNSDRAINYNKQLRQARRKEIRHSATLNKLSTPVKTADPFYRGRTNVRHIG